MDNKLLGERVRSARGDLSLRDFAKKCGISHTHLDSIEKGYDPRTGKPVSVSMNTLAKLSIGTGLSIDYLMGNEDAVFNGTAFEGMNRTQVDLYLLSEYLGRIDEKYPDISDDEKKACIAEFYKCDIVETMLSYLSLSDGDKSTVDRIIKSLIAEQEGGK